MQVMQVIAEILKREGVSTLFCFPTTPIIEAAAAAGIKPVVCRQERVGVHMADGFARVANGRPPGPDCSACIMENPGDVRPCVKICHQPESDTGGADAGGVIR